MVDKARLVLLNDRGEILLMGINLPNRERPLWVTLGGHRNQNETVEQAGAREAFEETGVRGITIGPVVWRGQQMLDVEGKLVPVNEDFLLANFPVGATLSFEHLEAEEKSVLHGIRWWNVDELREHAEDIRPPGLTDLLKTLISGEIPQSPITIKPSTP